MSDLALHQETAQVLREVKFASRRPFSIIDWPACPRCGHNGFAPPCGHCGLGGGEDHRGQHFINGEWVDRDAA